MLVESLLTVAGVHLVSVASPGPDFAVVTKSSIQGGRLAGAATAFGIVTANLLYVLLVLAGLSIVVQSQPAVLMAIKYLGAAFLVYLSYKCIQSNGMGQDIPTLGHQQNSLLGSYFSGLATSLLNPKAILYFTSVLAQFVRPDSPALDRTLYGAMVVAISGLWFLSVAHLISLDQIRVRFIQASKWIDRGMAVVLFGFAIGMMAA